MCPEEKDYKKLQLESLKNAIEVVVPSAEHNVSDEERTLMGSGNAAPPKPVNARRAPKRPWSVEGVSVGFNKG